jgi:2-polyprenyl-6-methoxyphenol hydroxylase-like FAD-dependent oxidoreductase
VSLHDGYNNYPIYQPRLLNSFSFLSVLVQGQGANQALIDALSLAGHLYKASRKQDPLTGALHSFEVEMLERSAVKVKASAEAAKFLHTSVAIQEGNVTRGAAHKDTRYKQ